MKKITFWFLIFLVWASDGRAQAPYYEGKTLRIVVGYPAGSAHDQWGRLIAPSSNQVHYGKSERYRAEYGRRRVDGGG